MKITLLSLLIAALGFNVMAQPRPKVDTIYYLLDTAQTPVRDRIWEIGVEGKFKYYTILCACLKYGQQPTFFFRKDSKAVILSKSQLEKLNFITLTGLIQKAKKITDESISDDNYRFFFIEPLGDEFVSHLVSLNDAKKIVPIEANKKIKTLN